MDIYQSAQQFHAGVLKSEQAALTAMLHAYAVANNKLNEEIDQLTKKIATAQAKGQFTGTAWLFQEHRLAELQAQVQKQLALFTAQMSGKLADAQAHMITLGVTNAQELIAKYAPPAKDLPVRTNSGALFATGALAQITSFVQQGSALHQLLEQVGPGVAQKIGDTLIGGLAAGHHPSVVARALRADLGGGLYRAQMIARTEMLRAHREATRQTYLQTDTVSGWRWLCARQATTCAMCWAMDGTEHKKDEPMGTHPNCRCTSVPIFPGTMAKGKTGAELFAELPDEKQAEILGPGKFAAFKSGAITLPQLVKVKQSPQWGVTRSEASLKDALGATPLPPPPAPKPKKPKAAKSTPVNPPVVPPVVPPPPPAQFNASAYTPKAPYDNASTQVLSTQLRAAAKAARNANTFASWQSGVGAAWHGAAQAATSELQRAGLSGLDYEARLVPVAHLTQPQPADQAEAQRIAHKLKEFAEKKIELSAVPDHYHAPLVVDADGKIIAGAERHEAARLNGDSHVLVLVPKGQGTGQIVNLEAAYDALKGVPAGRALLITGPPPKPPKPSPPPPKPEPYAPPPVRGQFPAGVDSLKVIKRLGGSTGAELVEDPATGKRYVRKTGASPDHLREEMHADNAYRALGVRVPEAQLYETPAGPVKLAEFIEGKTLAQATKAEAAKAEADLRRHFAADALLGNWDVIGMSRDNVLVDAAGHAWRIDNGGSLRFRAQGTAKTADEWNDHPTELFSLRREVKGAPKNASTMGVYGSLGIYDLHTQIRDMASRRKELLAALPFELQASVRARLAALEEVATAAEDLQHDEWRAGFAEEMTEHLVGLRKSGIAARFPRELRNRGGHAELVEDEHGKQFDHMRGAGSLVDDLASYMTAQGGDHKFVQRWQGAQAGNSWAAEAAGHKYFLANERTLDVGAAYFWGDHHGVTLQKAKGYFEAHLKQAKGTEASYRTTTAIYHAFNYLFLKSTGMANNDPERRAVHVVRTEDKVVMKLHGVKPGAQGLRLRRGACESTSIFRTTTVKGHEPTSQWVPWHRVCGMYLFTRKPGQDDSGFLGDGENEFACMLEGLDCNYEPSGYRHTPQSYRKN